MTPPGPPTDSAPRYCLFGAAGDTGNLGVSALGESTLQAIARREPEATTLVFDNGRGRRPGARGARTPHLRDGAWLSRRIHRSESLWTMEVSSRLGLPPNRNVEAIRRAHAVLDISGGDSFTDLYGRRRWQMVVLPKQMTLRIGTPLVLLPQTYGPFEDPARRRTAADLIAGASTAWTRDQRGIVALAELLGDRFDPDRHREGVDVAFALPATRPAALGPDETVPWLTEDGSVSMGLNVSGLIANEASTARAQFGLTLDYRRTVRELAQRLLDGSTDRLVLVPHVRGNGPESDDRACRALADDLGDPRRVSILPSGLNASETKWCISQLDWFCGTRMHATIAALSSGVPAAALAYSIKTKGVFDSCGMADSVVDAREVGSDDAVELLLSSAMRRDSTRDSLRVDVAPVVRRASRQFDEILGVVERRATS